MAIVNQKVGLAMPKNPQEAAKVLTAMKALEKGLITKQEYQSHLGSVAKNVTPQSKTSNRPGGKEQPASTSWIEVRLANGEVKWGKVEVYTPSKVAITVCNSIDTTDLIRIH